MASVLDVFHCARKCGEVEQILAEVHRMYLDQLRKIEKLKDPTELKVKLFSMWVRDLMEQNQSLAQTLAELEEVSIRLVLQLVEQVAGRRGSPGDCDTDTDGHTPASLRALVRCLQVDIDSLLELIHRIRTEGSWDVGGLVFHQVTYDDIFGKDGPPTGPSNTDALNQATKSEAELNELKSEVDQWRNLAEAAEAEIKSCRMKEMELQQEIDHAHKLAKERELILACKCPDTELMRLQHDELNKILEAFSGLKCIIAAACEDLEKLISKDLKEMVGRKRCLVPDVRATTGRFQRLAQSLGEEFTSMEEQNPTYLPGTCIFDCQKMNAFQRSKVENLNNYFLNVIQEVHKLEMKFESDPKVDRTSHVSLDATLEIAKSRSEDAGVEDSVHTLTLAVCQLMELAGNVHKLANEWEIQARRHRDVWEDFVEERKRICSWQQKLDSRTKSLSRQLGITASVVQQLEQSVSALGARRSEESPSSQHLQCLRTEDKQRGSAAEDAPIRLASLLSSKLNASRDQASVQQEKIDTLKQSISRVSQHMKCVRDGAGKDCKCWWTEPEIKVLEPVHRWSRSSLNSEEEESHPCGLQDKTGRTKCHPKGAGRAAVDPDVEALLPALRALTAELSSTRAQLQDTPCAFQDWDSSGTASSEKLDPDAAWQAADMQPGAPEGAELRRQLEACLSKLQSAEEEVANQERIIAIMTDSAKAHNSTVEHLGSRIQELEQEITQKEEKIRTLTATAAALEASECHRTSLENAEGAMESRLVGLRAQADGLGEENQVLQEQLRSSAALIDQLEGFVRESTERLERLREANAGLEQDNWHLSRQLEEERRSAELGQQLPGPEEHALEATVFVGAAAGTETQARLTYETYQMCLGTSGRDEEGGVLECAREERLASLGSEVQALRQTVADQASRLEAAEEEGLELRKEYCDVKQQLDSAWESVAEQERTVCALREKIAGLEADCRRQQQKVVSQEEELSEMKRAAARVAQLEFEARCLRDKLDEAKHGDAPPCTDGQRSTSETELLRRLCAPQVASTARLHEPTGLKRVLSSHVRHPLCSNEALKTLVDMVKAEKEIKSLKNENAALKNELLEYRSQNIDYQQLKVHADAEALRELEARLQAWAQENADLRTEVQLLSRRSERLQLDLRLAQRCLQDITPTASCARKSDSEERQEAERANRQHEAATKQLRSREDQLQAEVTDLEAVRVALVKRNVWLERNNTRLLRELHDLKARLDGHLRKEEGLIQRVKQYQGKHRELNRELAAMRQQHASPSQDSLYCLIDKVLEDFQMSAELHASLQQCVLMTDSDQSCSELRVEWPWAAEKQHACDWEQATSGEQPASKRDKDWLVAEVTRFRKLWEDAEAQVATLSEQLSLTSRLLQSSQRRVASLTKDKEMLEAMVGRLRAVTLRDSDLARLPADRRQLVKENLTLHAEREALLEERLDYEHVNSELCQRVEHLERQLQMLEPTRDSDFTSLTSD
ncbi:uncharacterized protein LOC134539123 isoform X2 [Bacillus rossius redtenbacheri]|uniref:uncharacterized protein LOC134539123 isoform X2 n=1 Tax=Bacillus rossius redtenbacheri TaxID=93214 RepID=UPI002FDC8549